MIPRWAATMKRLATASEKEQTDVAYFDSTCLLKHLYHVLSQNFTHAIIISPFSSLLNKPRQPADDDDPLLYLFFY